APSWLHKSLTLPTNSKPNSDKPLTKQAKPIFVKVKSGSTINYKQMTTTSENADGMGEVRHQIERCAKYAIKSNGVPNRNRITSAFAKPASLNNIY
ncbi:MAG: hypothetical protein AB1861_15295, partial [Cyanobacteriota bacterium]